MKKITYNFLHSKASKRIISAVTAIVMMFGVLPINEISEEYKGLRSQYLSASAESETTEDDDPIYYHVPSDSNKISVKIEDLVGYSEACAKYHKYHKDDELTILGSQGDTRYFQAGFKGLGTSTYPFGGSVTIENNANVTINLDAPLFNYVYDDVVLNGGNYINISREYDGGRSDIAHNTPILAQNVLPRNGGTNWKINLSKPSDDQDGLSYNLSDFGGMIGTMQSNASLFVDVIMNTSEGDTSSAVIDGYDSLGFACGTIQNGAELTFTMSSDRKIANIYTTSGNVGGLVGTVETGATFTYNGINNQNASALIKTDNGYAGGIVGSNAGTVNINLLSGETSYAVTQYIEGTGGAGGVYGYYVPSVSLTSDAAFNTSKYSINCQVNGNGTAGGLFGMLDTSYDVTINGGGVITANHFSGDCVAYGGLIGQYKADTLSRALTIDTVTANPSKYGSADYYGGGIGQIESSTPTYVKFNSFTVNKAYDASSLTFGGLVASADNAFVDAANVTVAVDGTFKGGAIIGHTESGVLRMSGSTNISGAKSAAPSDGEENYVGQLVGYRNNALVFGASDWSLTRYNGNVSVDDIGAWGEVLRYYSVITVDETAHTIKVNSPSSSYTSIGSTSDFVISALNFQFDETALLSFTTAHTDISNSDISITSSVDLSGTGITGLTRDNDIGENIDGSWVYNGEKCTYSGKISAGNNTITLAIGEPYGNGISSHDMEGRGKIYRHTYNGLVGIANGAEFENIKFAGKADVSANKDGMYVGTAAAQVNGTLGASSVKTESNLVMTVDGSGKVYAGRLAGYCTDAIGDITVSSGTFDGKLTGTNGAGESCFGGVIGKITHDTSASLDWDFTTVTLKGEVSNTVAKTQRLGGLIAEISGYNSSGDVRKLTLDGVSINGLKVSGRVSSNSQGGLLGYSWLNTNVNVKSVTLSSNPAVSMTGTGATAGLVYRATGHWSVTSLDMTGINVIAQSASSLGMIVNKGISHDDEKLYSENSRSAIYLEILSDSAYTLSWGSQKSLPSTRANYVFDELCAYTAPSHDYIMRNGNGIVSVPSSGLKMEKTAENSLSYDAQTTEGETANSNTRYYYNLQNIDSEKTLSADKEKLLAWGVRQYACKNLTGCFADPSFSNNTIPNGTYDMKELSWYPVTLDSSTTISGTFKLYNKEFELCEAKSANVWSSLNEDTSATQHYMLHNGLFYNMTGNKTLTVKNATLQGNVANMSDGSGFIICGTAQGSSATNKATITINGLILDGAYIHDISSNDYAPLIINNIGSHTNLNVKNVSTNDSYKSMTAALYPGMLVVDSYPKAASSLIGNVGLDTSATGLNVEFSAIRLDGRTSAVDDTNGFNTELDNAYGTMRTIFTSATLLNKFQYDSGSNGKYDYKLSEDWDNGHHYSEDSEHNKTYLGVTYGKEVGYKDTDTNTEYPGKERIYIEGGKYTNPIDSNDTTGTYANFNGFLPYVATGYNKSNKTHQLKINHGATVLSGCGTYNDPYILADGDLETVAGIINGGNTGTIILPIKSSSSEYSATELLSADWDSNGHAAYKWDSSNLKFRQFTITGETTTYSGTGFDKETVRQYLAHAYYSLNADIEIADGFVGLGSVEDDTSTTGEYYFRGVIVGNEYTITNKSSEPLVKYSNGSVVKNVNIVVDRGITANESITGGKIEISEPTALAFPSAKAYGAVIGQVLGGDNIIDTVSVAFTNTTIDLNGEKQQLVPIGGYIGVIEKGGVYFRGMNSLNVTDIQGLTSAVNSHVAENDRKYLYVNPIIGRVINGFAVTESNAYRPYETGTRKLTGGKTEQILTNSNGAVTMNNNNKHYSITDISASEAKLNITNTAISVQNGQAFFIMSLIVNSGMANGSLGYNQSYQCSRWADYDEVGADATAAGDYATAQSDSKDIKGWLMHNYATGTTDISGANETTVSLNTDTRYVLPDGYKGIGNIFQNDDKSRMKISTLYGHGSTIEQGTYYYYYDRTFDYHPESSGGFTGYLPNGGYQGGLGLINYTKNALTVNDLYLTGSVKTDLIDTTTGQSMTKTCKEISDDNDHNDSKPAFYNYLCAGMLIGTIKGNLTANNTVLDNIDVLGISHTGGMTGFLTHDGNNLSTLTYTVQFLDEDNKENTSVYNSKDIKVHGRTCVGGLIGKINKGYAKVDMNKHTFNLTQVECDTESRNSSYYFDYGVGGFVGMMRSGLNEVDSDLINNPSNYFKNIIIGTENEAQTVTSKGDVFTGGVVGIMNKCKGISIENCDFYNMSVTSEFAAAGLVAFPTTYTPARAVNVNLYSPLGSTIESTNDYAGGLIASSDPRKGDGSREFTFDRCLVENYIISGKEGAGGVIGFRGSCNTEPLIVKNVEVKDCTIKSDKTAGGLAGEIINPFIGYNILLNNVMLSSITDQTDIDNPGHICGSIIMSKTAMASYGNAARTGNECNNTPYIKLTGFSRQGTDSDMEKDVIGNCYYDDNIYGDGGYVIFADYDGKAISNHNDKFSNVVTSGENPVERIATGAKQITTDYTIIAQRDSSNNLTVVDVSSESTDEDCDIVPSLAEGAELPVSSEGTRYRYVPPAGMSPVSSISELTDEDSEKGIYIWNVGGGDNNYYQNNYTSYGYFTDKIDVLLTGRKVIYKTNLSKNKVQKKNDPYNNPLDSDQIAGASIWYFEKVNDNLYRIYTKKQGVNNYLYYENANQQHISFTTNYMNADTFELESINATTYRIKSTTRSSNKYLEHSGGGGGVWYGGNANNNSAFSFYPVPTAETLQVWTYNSGLDYTNSAITSTGTPTKVDANSEQAEDYNTKLTGYDNSNKDYEVLYIRKVVKENIFEDADNLSPFVTTSPKFNISSSQWLTGDGVSSVFFNTSAYKHIIDDIADENNKSYGYAEALTAEQRKMVSDHISNSAKEYNNYSGLPNFPLLVVDDTDYMAITSMIDDYLHMLTNTNYPFETDETNVYEVGLHKCVWNGSSFVVDTGTASGCLKKYSYGGMDYFRMTADDVDTGALPQFTLMDIKFLDPNDSSKVAYHLYVPIYVKKLLQFNFTASFASNTDYYVSAYKYYGNTMFENLGNPVTLKFEYQYTRTTDEWKVSINSGDSVQTNYAKSLILTNQTGAWPANTKMVLVDASNGDKRYYLDTPPSGNSIDLYDFTSDEGRTEHYSPVPLNDLMSVTIDGDDSGQLLLTDSSGTSETLTIGAKSYPATVKGTDEKFYAYVSEDEIPNNVGRYSVTAVTYPKAERYYLSIFTPKSSDTTIYHYEISSKESFPKPDNDDAWRPNKILNKSQVVHLFIGDLYDNDLTLEVEPRKHGIQLMNKDNNFLTVTMTANVALTTNAKNSGVGNNMYNNISTSSIYQTFVQTYDMLDDVNKDSEIGIVPEAGLNIGDREGAYYIKAGIITNDSIENDSNKIENPEYLYDPNKDTQIELRNNENLIRYLADSSNGNAVTLRVKYDLAYSANDLSYQFPKKGTDNVGTKVIGYSNISSSVDSAAYSATSERKEDNYDTNGNAAGIRYYTDDDTKASLNFMVVETKSDPAGPYSYLGKNALELGNTLSFVDTNAVYDTRNLKNSDEYIELTMELYGKWDNYRDSRNVTDYLKNIKISGIGSDILFDQTKTDLEQTNAVVKVDTSGGRIRLWVKKDQLRTQADGRYLFPISYDVLTGDDAFNVGGYKYSNYKVSLTAVTCNELGSTTYSKSSYATDHLIYTNAKVESSVIK